MHSQNELTQQINGFIETALERGECITTNWIAQAVINTWPEISGPGTDDYRIEAWDSVRGKVRKSLNRYKAKPEEDEQIVLPGYLYLQKAYTVERNGEPTVVPVSQLTGAEIIARMAEYDRMGRGCFKHRDELGGYYYRNEARLAG